MTAGFVNLAVLTFVLFSAVVSHKEYPVERMGWLEELYMLNGELSAVEPRN